jgi:hypothetical protein
MRVEHKLSPDMQAYFKQANEQLNQNRRDYLQALGMAKELEMRGQTLNAAFGEQVAIIQRTEKLPEPIGVYRLSEDATKIIGETADPPSAAPPANQALAGIEPEVLPRARVNGA